MRILPPKTTFIILAALLAMLGQGFAFVPSKFDFLLRKLPSWGNLTFSVILFSLAILGFALILRSTPFGARTNWTLLAIQAVSTAAGFFLQDGAALRIPELVFLFTGAITTLTVLGILTNQPPAAPKESSPPSIETPEKVATDASKPYAESNSRVLREQLESVLRKLNTEKNEIFLLLLNQLPKLKRPEKKDL